MIKATAIDNPNDALPYFNRASARNYLKNYREAIEDYNQAIKLGVPPDGLFVLYYSRMARRNGIRQTAEGRRGFWQKFCLALSAFNTE